MPTKRSGLAAASVNSEIYTFGGQSINGTFDNNERYDTKSDLWYSDLPMPTSRLGLEAVSSNSMIYALGGKTDLGIVGANEIFHTGDHSE
jgi:N-acetylneuraminic acid mutarotase